MGTESLPFRYKEGNRRLSELFRRGVASGGGNAGQRTWRIHFPVEIMCFCLKILLSFPLTFSLASSMGRAPLFHPEIFVFFFSVLNPSCVRNAPPRSRAIRGAWRIIMENVGSSWLLHLHSHTLLFVSPSITFIFQPVCSNRFFNQT